MKKCLLLIFISLFALSSTADEGFASLEEQMTGDEFGAAGLSKLSQGELDALNRWIRSHSLATLDQPKAGVYAYAGSTTTDPAQDLRGFEKQPNIKVNKKDRITINSRLKGTFSGWDGNTVFELENGMIWEQANKKDRFYIKPIENPVVVIEPGAFKTWHLSVEGHFSDVKVERVQ